jgi:hypothetical protein
MPLAGVSCIITVKKIISKNFRKKNRRFRERLLSIFEILNCSSEKVDEFWFWERLSVTVGKGPRTNRYEPLGCHTFPYKTHVATANVASQTSDGSRLLRASHQRDASIERETKTNIITNAQIQARQKLRVLLKSTTRHTSVKISGYGIKRSSTPSKVSGSVT